MTDPSVPQPTTPLPENLQPTTPQPTVPPTMAPHPAGSVPHPPTAPRRLPTFLKVSIVLLSALSIAAISLLFIGDFQGKFERVFATFLVFAVFVVLTAIDTRRDLRSDWYAPVALIANAYILALLLVVTWMSPFGFWLGWDLFWKSVLVVVVVRAVIFFCQLLIAMGNGRPEPLVRFAFVTSVLAVVTGILFTAPVAIELFGVWIPELYWRIAVAALLLTALGLAITLLLRWSYGSADREEARRAREAQRATASQLLPWPRYPDGRPLPVGPDGQPDFTALHR